MSERFFVATRKGLFTIERNGRGESPWKITGTAFLADPVYIVMHDPRDDALYAALGHGHFGVKVHRSRDEGATWHEVAAPAYPTLPEGQSPDRCQMSGREIPWRTELIWSLAPGGPDEPGVLWCGTVPGGLFKSTDHGDSWNIVRSLWDEPLRKAWFGGGLDYPGIHAIAVDPRDSKRVTLGVSCGGVWQTTDGGDTWACRAEGMFAEYMPPEQRGTPHVQDPHMLVACDGQPDAMWVQHHNGVFRTVDGAASWQHVPDMPPSDFGFAVAVHPQEPDTAWLVPAIKDEHRIPVDGKVVVTRTRDGGNSFEVLRRGLPQEHAYDLTFRHALDVDQTGDRLAFGSTTGSLWVSEDQGDSWQTISQHLPPVYCVRFANG